MYTENDGRRARIFLERLFQDTKIVLQRMCA